MSTTELLRVVETYFGDTSRSREETKAGLEELIDKAQSYLDTL